MVGKIIRRPKINRYDKRSLRNNNNINNRKYRSMNILDHEVLTEKLQKKPNKSYIQKVQQFEGNKTMSFKKFQATGRKFKK